MLHVTVVIVPCTHCDTGVVATHSGLCPFCDRPTATIADVEYSLQRAMEVTTLQHMATPKELAP